VKGLALLRATYYIWRLTILQKAGAKRTHSSPAQSKHLDFILEEKIIAYYWKRPKKNQECQIGIFQYLKFNYLIIN
jgi:hypothetical protein